MNKNYLFNYDWMKTEYPDNSWAKDVLDDINNYGSVYLDSLSKWFEELPGSNKQKNHLKAGLLNPDNCAHLGAVNELSWWIYLTSRGFSLDRIPAGKKPTPDFILNSDKGNIIFEVTTLNPSKDFYCNDLQYSQANSLRRMVRKATEDKHKQFIYGAEKNIPVVLIVFNYDEWSGFGTQFFRKLKDSIIDCVLPKELSSIIYLERHVIKGQSVYKNESASIFRNPNAQVSLKMDIIESLLSSENNWLPCEKT
jgi:hypothetical protein